MIEVALIGLENAINGYLRLDPETIKRIAALDGKAIKLDIEDWGFYCFILPTDNGIQLSKHYSGTPDTTIRGTLNNLLKLSCSGIDTKQLFKNNISIDGDTELGAEMRDMLQGIDIDWEEHLSKIVGDTLAHQIGKRSRQAFNTGKNIMTSLRQSFKEYVFHEKESIPTTAEFEQFYQDIATLRDDVDRFELRVKKHLNQTEASHD